MSIANIIDRRKRPYRWAKVNAIIEPTHHDNACVDSDKSPDEGGPDYDECGNITVGEAVAWAGDREDAVTLYLYDENDGISVTRVSARG